MNICNQVKQHAVKLALLSAFAIGAASTMGSAAAPTATATASATVIAPINIVKVGDLSFGSFIPSGSPGTVVLDTVNGRTLAGGVKPGPGGTISVAQFTINGQASTAYGISYATDVTLTGPTGSMPMALTQVSDLDHAIIPGTTVPNGVLNVKGMQSLFIGGSLAVAGGQMPGDYYGTITATVNYN
jgi:spore coat protein U-like protein